ncbi:MAG: histidine--tRNA ligase [Clostridiales bacterium]|nr:histidine--tRNA ligase [Clostridiales bacterium]
MEFIKTPVKGMNDFLPADMRLREYLLSMIKEAYASYGFMQIETPVMEHIENLTSKQGGDNEKLIFKVMKRGADLQRALQAADGQLADNGLRYDLTVPLARFYANNKEKLPTPFKSLQMGNVWRADNPQKGRFRQFTQCDIDILGDETNLAEIELIGATVNMLSAILGTVGLSRFTVRINDRQLLRAAALYAGFSEDAIDSVLISLDKFDKIGFDGIRTELIENGAEESTVDRYLAVYQQVKPGCTCAEFAGLFQETLPEEVIQNIDEIIACVRTMVDDQVELVFDPTLVRGMGYYTGPIFEIGLEGYSFSIAGGGRYDKMIGKFCGQDVCACGFSIGFERIVTILRDSGVQEKMANGEGIAFLLDKNLPSEKKVEIFAKAMALRKEGKRVSVQPLRKNPRPQIEKLEKEGFTQFEKIYRDR